MSNCINCKVRLSRVKQHALSDETEQLVKTIKLWTSPREITPEDHICHECWELATCGSGTKREIGHDRVCVVCGCSVIRLSRRKILFEGPNEEQKRLSDIISSWIRPRELSLEDEACVPCWLRAERTTAQQPDSPQQPDNSHQLDNSQQLDDSQPPCSPEHVDVKPGIMCAICFHSVALSTRPQGSYEKEISKNIAHLVEVKQMPPEEEVCGVCWKEAQGLQSPQEAVKNSPHQEPDYITLPNIRRAPETTKQCVFQSCKGTKRQTVPDETRLQVLKQFQYFIPKGARICTKHLQEARFENLHSAENSLNTFTAAYIEDMTSLLMQGLKYISYENIQNLPDNQVEYFIGMTKEQYQQILDATPRLRDMNRGSFALTAFLCKLRTGDTGDRLSGLFRVPRRTLESLMSLAKGILIADHVISKPTWPKWMCDRLQIPSHTND